MSVYLSLTHRQRVGRWVQRLACWCDGKRYDVVHLSIGDEGTGAGGIVTASYVEGLDDPAECRAVEARMQSLCDAINSAFPAVSPPDPKGVGASVR